MKKLLILTLTLLISVNSHGLDVNYLLKHAPEPEVISYYKLLVFVNTARQGPSKQRMWVVEQDDSLDWQLAMWDKKYWEKKNKTATYSWPISGSAKGIFNLDERKTLIHNNKKYTRYKRGKVKTGIYDLLSFEHHLDNGHPTSLSLHGINKKDYIHLGLKPIAYGVGMHQENSQKLYDWIHSQDHKISTGQFTDWWGLTPKFFLSKSDKKKRSGYFVNASPVKDDFGIIVTKRGYRVLVICFQDEN